MSLKGEAAKSIAAYNIFETTKKVKELNKEELQFEVTEWRKIWDYIPLEMQGLLSQLGQKVIVFKRDGQSFQGYFAGMKVTVTDYQFKTQERIRDNVQKEFYIYETETSVPKSNVIDFKFVKQMYEDTPDPYLNPSPSQESENSLSE
jgi:hypothetical protein